MIKRIEDLYEGAQPYLKLIGELDDKLKLKGAAVADHICYKCGSHDSFGRIRALLEPAEISRWCFTEVIPAKTGRLIAYFRLVRPLETPLGPAQFLELSDQKSDNSQIEGFAHLEVYATDYRLGGKSAYDKLVEMIAASGKAVAEAGRPRHKAHDVDIGGGFTFRCSERPIVDKIIHELVESRIS